jgi:hypothetical protein
MNSSSTSQNNRSDHIPTPDLGYPSPMGPWTWLQAVLPHVARAVPAGAILGSLCLLGVSPLLAAVLLGLQAVLPHVARAVPAGAILGSLCLLGASPLLAAVLLGL